LGGAAAFRISGAVSSQDPLLAGYEDGQRQHSGRAQVKALLGDGLSVRVAADYNRLGGTGPGSSYVGNYVFVPNLATYQFVDSGLAPSEGLYSPKAQAYRQTISLGSAGRTLDAIGSRPEQDHHFYGAHARVDADLGFAKLVVIPAWRRASLDSIVSSAPFGYRLAEKNAQRSVEARLAGRDGPVEWLGGAFVFDETIDSSTTTNLSSSLVRSRQRYETFSNALFGNLTLHASSLVRLSAGLRWTRDRKRFASEGQSLAIICQRRVNNRPSCPTVPLFPLASDFKQLPLPVPTQPGSSLPILIDGTPTGAIVRRSDTAATGRLVDQAPTWRFGAETDLAASTLLYLTGEKGYRPGGFNGAVGFETYDPERITAYTLGLRHRALEGRLSADLEAFWWDYRDQQVSSLRPDLSTPPRNANITDNIGSSQIRGAEADLRYRPWRGAQAGAVVQYLDARYRSFEYVYANTGVPPLTGCDAVLNSATNLYTVDCSDKQPYNSPRWSMTLMGRQSVQLGGILLTAAAETHLRTTRNIGFAFLGEQRIGPTWTSNAQVSAQPGDGRVEIAAFVRNIEGRRVPQFMIYHPVSNALVAVTSPPRQWGLRIAARL
jgi:iron complex outermembrane receptor protein